MSEDAEVHSITDECSCEYPVVKWNKFDIPICQGCRHKIATTERGWIK